LHPSADGIVVPTGTEPIELLEVQPEGKPRMPARAWANGAHWQRGETLAT
jgi:methionyl-tRNA formyltransferase